jgi:hypothetical protein
VSPIVVVLITVAAGGFSSLIGAILLGKLVPSSRLVEANQRVAEAVAVSEKWKLAYETEKKSNELLEETVKRQHLVTDTANMLIGMIRQTANPPPLSSHPQVGGST